MSKFLEYLNLIPKGLSNPKLIAEGWLTATKVQLKTIGIDTLSEDEEAEIVRRRAICEGCPFSSMNAKTSPEYKTLYELNYETQRQDPHCSCCGCPLIGKVSSFNSACGLETYNLKNLNNIQPLKWGPYIKKTN